MGHLADNFIHVRGAREHNLCGVDLELPHNQLICFTGVSGSGKSSLAFDTLFAEGQRRYIESLSAYARQFLGQHKRPDIDLISGLSPSIAIQQKTQNLNPRSTVGTITQIHDFLRVLFARLGTQHCPRCDRPITAQSREQIIAQVLTLPAGTRALVLAPVVRGQKGEFRDLFSDLMTAGYARVRVDGTLIRLADATPLARNNRHNIEVVVDRLKIDATERSRLAEAVDDALRMGEGTVIVSPREDGAAEHDVLLSAQYACTSCNISFEPPTPQMFSPNSPHGMCVTCDGLGEHVTFDPDLLVPDDKKSFMQIAIAPMRTKIGRWRKHLYEGVAQHVGFDLRTPWKDLSTKARTALLFGTGDEHITYSWRWRGGVWRHGGPFVGIIADLEEKYRKASAPMVRRYYEKFMRRQPCNNCAGTRLNQQASSVRIGGATLHELLDRPIAQTVDFFNGIELSAVQQHIAEEILKEIRSRLQFLLDVGLHYLTLGRSAPTLSGGESQRIRLASQIGSGLTGVLYILDEPSIGLHHRDHMRLVESLRRLCDLGNTVVVVEHDEDTMRAADLVVDFGPGPGVRGGHVVASGSIARIASNKESLTGAYLAGRRKISIPAERRPVEHKTQRWLEVHGAAHNNLKDIDVKLPLGRFVCVTGVSGSGKSSLVRDIIREKLSHELNGAEKCKPGEHRTITGQKNLDKVIDIDQSPIGRTPRSNPATYIKLFDHIRDLYASMPDSKVRGYRKGRFSFNVGTGKRGGGRCESCEGNGSNRIAMEFLADVWVDCPVCGGRRFGRETLQILYRGKSIADVLAMDVQEALEHFENQPRIRHMLQTLHDVGLDYLKLGQSSTTLSGGEAQRIKLARELVKKPTGKTLYILDEPTTGLHFEDVRRLLEVLHGFVESGNSVLVIEHHLDVIKTADWLIDLGPEGGAAGGEVVVAGPPEVVARSRASHTGSALRTVLSQSKHKTVTTRRKKATRKSTPKADYINVVGAAQHNLRNVSTRIPHHQTTVFTGLSGSGKSSLALDTLYTEGHRRYVESLSSYARQFLGQLQKPKVERIEGLPPAIAIDQKAASHSPRSTVGTVTEIYDYLRVLYARIGRPHCPECARPITIETSETITNTLMNHDPGTRMLLMAPETRAENETWAHAFERFKQSGFSRVCIDGVVHELAGNIKVSARRRAPIDVVIDRVIVRPQQHSRIAESVEQALTLGNGCMVAATVDDKGAVVESNNYSRLFGCDHCQSTHEELTPNHFSFNSRLGWCPSCEGLGTQLGAPVDNLVADPRKSILDGAIAGWHNMGRGTLMAKCLRALGKHIGFDAEKPWRDLGEFHQRMILHGLEDNTWLDVQVAQSRTIRIHWKGFFPAIDQAAKASWSYRHKLKELVTDVPCQACGGARLHDLARCVRLGSGKNALTLPQLAALPLDDALGALKKVKLAPRERKIAGELLHEASNRLRFLVDLGLSYLALHRGSPTLSGGEAQRIRLASQLGSGLTGVLYVLDEPTIGLHPQDNDRLIQALNKLRDSGNTLCIVEHDREVIDSADRVVDFGPGAGRDGGQIIAEQSPAAIKKNRKSLTGRYLSGKMAVPIPVSRRPVESDMGEGQLGLIDVWHHNLKNIDVHFPLGRFTVVTGVSGSGKSSLVNDVLANGLAQRIHRARVTPGGHGEIIGVEHVDKAIVVDQSPLGQSPSSNAATYTGLFDTIRELFTRMPEAKVRGYTPGRFSFNRPGGRCENCEGIGQTCVEMHFLPDVWINCETCGGRRYNEETLAVTHRGKNIADVLNMSVAEAVEHFDNVPKVKTMLHMLLDVGLGYLPLGQSATTLSGGEAQRIKLAAELGKPSTGKTVYVLDEPTTGLHFEDLRKLVEVLQRLCDLGNTVVCIEHNLDLIKCADWIIELGPGAGDAGGDLVIEGTPEQITKSRRSPTGKHLASILAKSPQEERETYSLEAAAERQALIGGRLKVENAEEVALPWEKDGRLWHTTQCLSQEGTRPQWDPEALAFIVDQAEEVGKLLPADWKHRSRIELRAKKGKAPWFCHILTRGHWLLECTFRIPKRRFDPRALLEQLDLKVLDEREDLPIYGPWSRVRRRVRRDHDDITIWVHDLAEIDTPAFKRFVKQAVSAHCELVKLTTDPETAEPWKKNGRAWHMGQKAIPNLRTRYWKPKALVELVGRLNKIMPKVEIDWNNKTAVSLRHPLMKRAWGKISTASRHGLRVEITGKANQFTPTKIERLGEDPEIKRRSNRDVVTFWVREMKDVDTRQLTAVLKEAEASLIESI